MSGEITLEFLSLFEDAIAKARAEIEKEEEEEKRKAAKKKSERRYKT